MSASTTTTNLSTYLHPQTILPPLTTLMALLGISTGIYGLTSPLSYSTALGISITDPSSPALPFISFIGARNLASGIGGLALLSTGHRRAAGLTMMCGVVTCWADAWVCAQYGPEEGKAVGHAVMGVLAGALGAGVVGLVLSPPRGLGRRRRMEGTLFSVTWHRERRVELLFFFRLADGQRTDGGFDRNLLSLQCRRNFYETVGDGQSRCLPNRIPSPCHSFLPSRLTQPPLHPHPPSLLSSPPLHTPFTSHPLPPKPLNPSRTARHQRRTPDEEVPRNSPWRHDLVLRTAGIAVPPPASRGLCRGEPAGDDWARGLRVRLKPLRPDDAASGVLGAGLAICGTVEEV